MSSVSLALSTLVFEGTYLNISSTTWVILGFIFSLSIILGFIQTLIKLCNDYED